MLGLREEVDDQNVDPEEPRRSKSSGLPSRSFCYEVIMTVLNKSNAMHRCCREHLESGIVKKDLALSTGWIPLYQCPKCLNLWKRIGGKWSLLERVIQDPFMV